MNNRQNWTREDWLAFNEGWSFARLGYPKLTTQNPDRFREGQAAAAAEAKETASKRAAAEKAPS